MYNVSAIVPHGEGAGFTLAGVRVIEVSSIADVPDILSTELDDDDNGIILIDETYLENLPARLRKRVDDSTVPLVVGVPVITKWEYVHDRTEVIERIIQRAVGYRIKLGG